MSAPIFRALAVSLSLLATAALAEPQTLRKGDDLFMSDLSASEAVTAPRDLLAAGTAVVLRGALAQDTHATGFDEQVEAATGGSIYAADATMTLRGSIGFRREKASCRCCLMAAKVGPA